VSPTTISGLLQQATLSPAGARLSATLQPAIAGLPVTFSSGGTPGLHRTDRQHRRRNLRLTRIQVALTSA
jgi:hypothetical protein